MKRVYFNVALIIISLAVIVVFTKYSKGGSALGKIGDFYGEWTVVETQKFQGTLISDEKFKQLMKNPLIIGKEHMNFFGVEITNPAYKYYRINNKVTEGAIQDKTTSAFYGFYADRKFIHQFRIIKNDEMEGVFEVLSKEELLFMAAGRIIIVKRKK